MNSLQEQGGTAADASSRRAPACPGEHRPANRYRVGPGSRCLRHAVFSRRLLGTSVPICLVVGSILTAINQGVDLAQGRHEAALLWQIPLTYLVPFTVSSWSQLRALRLPRES
jgi:hypothetical protein